MGTFLLILILLFFVWPLLKVVFAIFRAQNNVRRVYKEAFDQQKQNSRKAGRSQTHERQRKGKIFDRTMGEYVEFEEIECATTTTPDESGKTAEQQSAKVAQRIVDADWEDIK